MPHISHKRRSVRLKQYNYSTPGYYYVTICTHNNKHIFGKIKNDEMVLNKFGEIVQNEWTKTKQLRDNVDLDQFAIMPNHIHGIIILCRGTARRAPTFEQFGKPTHNSLPTIIRGFKSGATKHINIFRNTPGKHVWQHNYYERIIRSDNELHKIREYINNNPINWALDKYNVL